MSQVKQYDYIEKSQKKFIGLNNLLSFILTGFIFSKLLIILKSLFIYYSVFNYIIIFSILIFLAGIFSGKLVLNYNIKSRKIFLISEGIFILFCLAFWAQKIIFPSSFEPLLKIFFISPLLLFIILSSGLFSLAIKTNYFLKICSGLFFDERRNIIILYLSAVAGFSIGICLNLLSPIYPIIGYIGYFIILLITSSAFVIKLEYNPAPIFAKQLDESSIKKLNKNSETRSYSLGLTLGSIIIYLYLGYLIINNFNNDNFKLFYIITISCSFLIGILISNIIKQSIIYFILELLIPVIFLLFFILVKIQDTTNILLTFSLFIPGAFLSGFIFLNTIKSISNQNNQKKIYNILLITTITIPGFLIILFLFLASEKFIPIILFHIALVINFSMSALYLLKKKSTIIKKFIYLFISLIFISLSIITHLGLKPYQFSDSKLSNCKKHLKDISREDLLINNVNSLQFKRTVSIISLYKKPEDTILFLNGYINFPQKDFSLYYPDSKYLEYVPKKIITKINPDLKNTAISSKNFLFFLQKKEKQYSIIIDLPNKIDQKKNDYRFSFDYYNKIKRLLNKKSIFVQILNISAIKGIKRNNAIKSFNRTFINSYAFLFNESLMLIGSDNFRSVQLTDNKLKYLNNFLKENKKYSNIFFNEKQSLAYLIYTQKNGKINPNSNYNFSPNKLTFEKLYTEFPLQNSLAINLFPEKENNQQKIISKFIAEHQKILSEFKKAELAALQHDYKSEIDHLFNLKEIVRTKYKLQNYINNIFSLKEEYYFKIALKLEQKKRWEKALEIYSLLLKINQYNFEANYRTGRLLITLQNLEPAFNYLQTALKLKRDNPAVLYQLGVLLFTNGKFKDALEYLQKALIFKKDDASIYFYIGLCHEELENLNQAKYYYKLAIEKEPENQQIIFSDKRVNEIIDKKRDQWKMPKRTNQLEEEKDEYIDLPINKNAIDKRLKDDENTDDFEE